MTKVPGTLTQRSYSLFSKKFPDLSLFAQFSLTNRMNTSTFFPDVF